MNNLISNFMLKLRIKFLKKNFKKILFLLSILALCQSCGKKSPLEKPDNYIYFDDKGE